MLEKHTVTELIPQPQSSLNSATYGQRIAFLFLVDLGLGVYSVSLSHCSKTHNSLQLSFVWGHKTRAKATAHSELCGTALETVSCNLIAELGLGRSRAFGQPGSLAALDLHLLGKKAIVLRKKGKASFPPFVH